MQLSFLLLLILTKTSKFSSFKAEVHRTEFLALRDTWLSWYVLSLQLRTSARQQCSLGRSPMAMGK